MSFEEGAYIDDVRAIRAMGIAPADVARVVSEAFCEQVSIDTCLAALHVRTTGAPLPP